jgi:hypothetical protein
LRSKSFPTAGRSRASRRTASLPAPTSRAS